MVISVLGAWAQTPRAELYRELERQGVRVDTTQALPDVDPALDPALELIAAYGPGGVSLRWAPTTPEAWLLGNYHGVLVDRLDLNDTVNTGFVNVAGPLRPLDLAGWKALDAAGQPDDYHLVAAEVLYGGHLQSLVRDGVDVLAAQELVDLLALVLLSADLSWPTAEGLAMAYRDATALSGHEYLYRVRLSSQSPSAYVREGSCQVLAKAEPAPAVPRIHDIVEAEHSVTLKLHRKYHEALFTAYHVERATTPAGPWQRLTEQPFIHGLDRKSPQAQEYIVYSDSLTGNYQPHYYRVLGLTPFGKTSPPSEVVRAQGRDQTQPPAAEQLKATTLPRKQVRLDWTYPTNAPGDFAGFWVGRSSQSLGGFEPLHKVVLPPGTRSFIDTNPDTLGGNYYLVGAIDTAGNGTPSTVVSSVIVDSLPPSRPLKLRGSVDSNGIVRLSWDMNPELDLLGYQVYFSHKDDYVFAGLTPKPIQHLTYQDTITIRTLKRDIYYYVVAVDATFNYSQPSDTLKLMKPDLVAPSPPVMTELLVTARGVVARWQPSSSDDVTEYQWLRRQGAGAAWTVLQRWPARERRGDLVDATTAPGQLYDYTLRCVDASGYESEIPFALHARGPRGSYDMLSPTQVALDTAAGGVWVRWSPAGLAAPAQVAIYRAVDGGPYDLVHRAEASEAAWLDRVPRAAGRRYEYALQVRGGAIRPSKLSAAVAVVVK